MYSRFWDNKTKSYYCGGFCVTNFNEFKKFKTIYVCGPQRSGTTFFAWILSKRLEYRLIDEMEFQVENFDILMSLDRGNSVVQCPGLSHRLEDLAGEDVCIVFMIRPIEDIIASQERIRWRDNDNETAKYGIRGKIISEVKYKFWEKQKELLDRRGYSYKEVIYEDLKSEPEFVEKPKRSGFSPKQVKI